MTRVAFDLFAGAGGAARGLLRSGFDRVVGVDVDPNPRYPGELVEADLTDGLPDRLDELLADDDVDVALTWASPPCQGITTLPGCDAPQLIPLARELCQAIGVPFAIENLGGAKPLLRDPVLLSGEVEAFDLDVLKVRLVETSFPVAQPAIDDDAGPFGFAISSRETPLAGYREAHGFHRLAHMTDSDVRQAIPPHYVAHVVAEQRGEALGDVLGEPLPPEGIAEGSA